MKLAALLKESGITQNEFAKKLERSQSLISQWVSGKCQPQIPDISRIANVLGVSTDEILACFPKKENPVNRH